MDQNHHAVDDIVDEMFEATAMAPQQARKAFPLVWHSHPHLTFDQWMAFIRRRSRRSPRRAGIVAVQDRRGYVHAIFFYCVDYHLQRSATLRVTNVVVGRLPGKIIDRAIVRSAERLAKEMGCRSLVFDPSRYGLENIDPARYNAL